MSILCQLLSRCVSTGPSKRIFIFILGLALVISITIVLNTMYSNQESNFLNRANKLRVVYSIQSSFRNVDSKLYPYQLSHMSSATPNQNHTKKPTSSTSTSTATSTTTKATSTNRPSRYLTTVRVANSRTTTHWGSWNAKETSISTPDPWRDRCKEVRRRISHGLEDYARRSGDAELQALVQPVFTRKKLVVWSADHHIGPMADLRSLFEPLGVEFLEHTLYFHCDRMCTCDQKTYTKVLDQHNVLHALGSDVIERFMREHKNDSDFSRADAYLSSWSSNLLELFMRYNRSIVFHCPIRFDYPLNGQPDHSRTVIDLIKRLGTNEANIFSANSRYDAHYIKYFTGINVDYVPSFCVYTGETYQPIRKSFLLWERRLGFNYGLREYWTDHFDGYIKRSGVKIELLDVRNVYNGIEYRDMVKHLGITHIPYQVSLMSFFEHYRMDIPLFCPSLEFIIFLHHRFYTVYDRTPNGGAEPTMRGSKLPVHPSMAGTPDPNNDFDLASIRYWMPLADCYNFPHITYFDSFEHLVETLHNMTEPRLLRISNSMRVWNRENLKEILRYWRRRLLNIAFYRMFDS